MGVESKMKNEERNDHSLYCVCCSYLFVPRRMPKDELLEVND